MALNAYPFESDNTTEDQYTLLFRNFADTGIVGSTGDSQFLVTTDGSGLDVQVAAGYAIIRGHAVQNDGPVTVNLDAADAAAPRIDRLVLRLDPEQDGIFLHVIKGTPNANPAVPSLTQTDVDIYDFPLANIRVAANALNVIPADITSTRRWGGHRFGVWSNATRPVAPFLGQPGFNTDIVGAEVWTGTAWESVNSKKRIVVPHTFTLAGPIAMANAAGDYFIPPFVLPAVTGQKMRLVGQRYKAHHGAANSSFTADIRLNGTTLSQITVGREWTSNGSNGTSAYFTAMSEVALVVTGIVGDPKNATVTIWVEYEA